MALLYDHDELQAVLSGPGAPLAPAAWQVEIEQRAAEVIAGRAELEDAEVVHRQIADRLRSQRG